MLTLLHTACTALALPLQDFSTAPAATVERDPSGLPTAWRLFPFGEISITKNGQDHTGTFTRAMGEQAVAFAEKKGIPIPIDAEHALFHLAQHMQVEESALAAALPSGSLAVGFGTLARRDDGLWLTDVTWTDIGQALIQGGAFRYFSPVLRGNADGNIRITSTSLTNNPAINRLDAIAAEADDSMERQTLCLSDLTRAIQPKRKEQSNMDKLLARLGAILGHDAIALAADGSIPETVTAALTTLEAELPLLRETKTQADAFLLAVQGPLALAGEPTFSTVEGTILALSEKAATAADLKTRVDALALEAETRKLAELTAQGLKAGQLSHARVQSDWFKRLDAAALEDFLKDAEKVVPLGGPLPKNDLPDPDAIVLTDEDRKVCAQMGLDEATFLAAKKQPATS